MKALFILSYKQYYYYNLLGCRYPIYYRLINKYNNYKPSVEINQLPRKETVHNLTLIFSIIPYIIS